MKRTTTITVKVIGILIYSVFCFSAFGQTPNFICEILNEHKEDSRNIVFDVYLRNTSPGGLPVYEYGMFQMGLLFNPKIINGGSLSATFVEGFSDLNPAQQFLPANLSIMTSMGHSIRVSVQWPGAPGNGTIISSVQPGTRVCRIRLSNTVDFADVNLNLAWSFALATSRTGAWAFINGLLTDITETGLFFAFPSSSLTVPGVPSGYKLTIRNDTLLNANTYDFDVYLQNTDPSVAMQLYGLQFGITLNPTILNGGTLLTQFLAPYSDLKPKQQPNNMGFTASQSCIRVSAKTASFGTGTIISPYEPGTRICRIRMTNSQNFAMAKPNFQFTNTVIPYKTDLVVFDWGTGLTELITNPSSHHTDEMYNPILNGTINLFDVTGGGAYPNGNPGLLVGLSGSENEGIKYVLQKDGNILGNYINGTGLPLNFGTQTAGIYTVNAHRTATYMYRAMNGSAIITVIQPINYLWNGSNNQWADAGNWIPNGIPGASDAVTIPAGLGLNYPIINTNTTINKLRILNDGALRGNSYLTVNDSIKVERLITGNAYHYISSPVLNPTAGSALPLTTYLRRYDEPSGNWVNLTSSDILSPTVGYSAFIPSSATAGFTGVLNKGTITTTSLTNLGNSGNTAYDGYNLIGNPYCSPIDLENGIIFSDVAPVAYFWNQLLNGGHGGYGVYMLGGIGINATQYVPVAQGFFVKANGPTPVVTFTESSRTFQNQAFYKKGKQNMFRIRLSKSVFSDETVIAFNENASEGYNPNFDAFKLKNGDTPSIYTKSIEGYELAINSFLGPMGKSPIPLYIEPQEPGVYTIELSDSDLFLNTLPIWIEDTKTGYLQNLRENPRLSFVSELTDKIDRFELRFDNNQSTSFNIGVYASSNVVTINSSINLYGTLQVVDLLGNLVYSQSLKGENFCQIMLSVPSGVYMVNIRTDENSFTKKVFIN